ncbi:MAG: alpha-galactosidase [Clostridia bacterium]|nr:alpha-galactosidase [Clostridia bacterium]
MINFLEKEKIFTLDTQNTTYALGVYPNGALVHLYYGNKIKSTFSIDDAVPYFTRSCSPVVDEFSETDLPMEFSAFSTDMRSPAIHARFSDGSTAMRLIYKAHKIFSGKKKLDGLPAFYTEEEGEAETLEITLVDEAKPFEVTLSYSVFPSFDVITRSVTVKNVGKEKIELLKVMSLSLDFQSRNFDFVHLTGAWAKERHIERVPVVSGGLYIDSKRGASSHFHNPAFFLADKNTDENVGDVYGFGLVYSGSFVGGAEKNSENLLRVFLGINDFDFKWILEGGDEFQAPEGIMCYSPEGFGLLSRRFHKIINNRLVRGKYRNASRPILINNWEATYFDFDEDKIVDIAKSAKELGVELAVLDDGWFGKRDHDRCSLGDWYPNKNKLKGGIEALAKRISDLGMKFGLWFEPEMVSPDSDLYRAHPDWALQIAGRKNSLSRTQMVLDLSRKEVCDYIVESISSILSASAVSYVKWDYNRNMAEIHSLALPPERQGEVAHRYILGLYDVLERLTTSFPDVLFEGCSGGGGRFDLGMLYYYPQVWTSDDSDAIERTYIQYGTSLIYPAQTMGAHVSAVPNHQVGRVTPFKTRGHVAMLGRLGYELDLGKLSEEEKEEVKEQIKLYKTIEDTVHLGEMYRLISPFDSNRFAKEFVSADGKTVVVVAVNILAKPNAPFEKICLKGLDKEAFYECEGKVYGGDFLENVGIVLKNGEDFSSEMMIFKRIEK